MSSLGWNFATFYARMRFHPYAPRGDTLETGIAESVRQDGIAFSSMAELGAEDAYRDMREEAAALKLRFESDQTFRHEILAGLQDEKVQKGARKHFLTPLYGGGWVTPELRFDSALIRFALSGQILKVAGSYLGALPRFNSFNLSETVVVKDDEEAKLSQRWHRDPEDRRIIKVFVYLSDVLDSGSGPFTYVKGSHLRGKHRALFPQQYPAGSYPPAGAVEKAVPQGDIVECFGPSGTVIFADTSGLHKGGFSTHTPRLMFTAGFVTDASPHGQKFHLPPRKSLKELSPLAREALLL